ncbi:MAG: DUF5685 family protein [Lachnospiraceae bacterium]|nr:DUF5685 family protein [Lachnospiraceae bacterium]
MFGYVNVNRTDLTTENGEIYQAYYCGLCQMLREKYGPKGQMLLNYDMTFLIVLLSGLYEPESDEKVFTCALHPTRKQRAYVSEIVEYAADMNVLLTYQNLFDDWEDDKDVGKRAVILFLEKEYAKLKEKYPRQSAKLEECLKKLSAAERSGEKNIDVLSGLSGEMIEEIFVPDENDIWADELRTLAFYLGKFIYIMDAYEDLDKDRKKGKFNPFITMHFSDEQEYETVVKQMLTSMMAECAKSFERLPIVLHADILRNIIYSGVWCKYEYIQLKKSAKDKRKKKATSSKINKKNRRSQNKE